MEQKQVQKITKDATIGDIIEKYPQTIEILEGFGVHCVGCHVSAYESLEAGFRGHGMDDKTIEEALKKLNEIVEKNPVQQKEQKEVDVSNATLNVTDKAAEKIKALMEKEKEQGLRISVQPGGCSGYQYAMELDDKSTDNDITIEEKGIKIFVDKKSMQMLSGANVDYVDSLQGAGFKIDNPNAKKTCGCGSSFG